MSTILITGSSSGFGLATAKLFLHHGWNVIATMRTPDPSLFPQSDNLTILPLDVTNSASIERVAEQIKQVDVLVNNAGFGAPVPVELTPADTAQKLMSTNVLGPLALTQAILPKMRAQQSGVIINVSSSVTTKILPLIGLYRASKAALNTWTESMAAEVKSFGVRVHLVLPGRSPETKFGENAREYFGGLGDATYGEMVNDFIKMVSDDNSPVTYADDVAKGIMQLVNNPDSPLYNAAGEDAELWLAVAQKASPFSC